MKNCPKCKKDFPKEDNFCDECGSKLISKKISIIEHSSKDKIMETNSKGGWFITFSLVLSIISLLGVIVSVLDYVFFLIFFNFSLYIFVIPIIPVTSLICSIISFKLLKKNYQLGKPRKVIFGVIFSSIALLIIVLLFWIIGI